MADDRCVTARAQVDSKDCRGFAPISDIPHPSVEGQGYQEGDQRTLTFTLGGWIQRKEGNPEERSNA